MKKKKEITMWAIWSPRNKNFVGTTFSPHKWLTLQKFLANHEASWRELYKIGYRAVKGKFVWEEK